jgi:hypothetical protein
VEIAVREGAVAVDVPDDGARVDHGAEVSHGATVDYGAEVEHKA